MRASRRWSEPEPRARLNWRSRKSGVTSAGAAILGGGSGSWWVKLASVLPLVALAGGLMLIQSWQTSAQISVAADIDAALLADDLPPKAYSDAGFVEFLKTPRD